MKTIRMLSKLALLFMSLGIVTGQSVGITTYVSNYRTLRLIDSYGQTWCNGEGRMRAFQQNVSPGGKVWVTSDDGVLFTTYLNGAPPGLSHDPESYSVYLWLPYWTNCGNAQLAMDWFQTHFCQYTHMPVYMSFFTVFGVNTSRNPLSYQESPAFAVYLQF